jgi:hypothetical protein
MKFGMSMDKLPEKKPWAKAKDSIAQPVQEVLKKLGLGWSKNIHPKNFYDIRDKRHVLVKESEFKSAHYFVFFDRGWILRVDLENQMIPETDLRVFTFDIRSNYSDVYDKYDEETYIVPVEEFTQLYPEPMAFKAPTLFDFSVEKDEELADENISALTIRDVLSIVQCSPVSNKEWLNQEIRKINVIRTKN